MAVAQEVFNDYESANSADYCQSCGVQGGDLPDGEIVVVLTDKAERAERMYPGSPATFSTRCPKCVEDGDFLEIVRDADV